MQLRSESIPGIPRTRDTERSMNKRDNSRKGVWKRVWKRVYTAKVISETRFEPETRFCRDDKRKVVLKRLLQCVPEKRTLKQWTKIVGCVTIIIFISWSMINMLSNDTLKFIQSCFTEQHCFSLNWMSKAILCHFQVHVHVGRGIVITAVQCGLA